MASRLAARVAGLFALVVFATPAWAGDTVITWHGHAAFQIVTPRGAVLMLDPWLNNPANPAAKDGDPLAAVGKVDYILITHGHFDHVADAAALAKRTGARLVANFELGSNLAKLHGYPKEQMGLDTLFNIGGRITLADGEVTVTMTPAVHSSGLNNPFADETDPDIVYGGNPGGFVIQIDGGPTLYDTGDTAYFDDMSVIGRQFDVTVALVNIGGHFGMEPDMAAQAVRAVKPRYVVPHHFGTFPVLAPDAEGFTKAVGGRARVMVMAPGERVVFHGDKLAR
ncbi:MAG: metal-dependent hydrolase [Nitrospirae bacterium]|nr:metal-dependent hydrolase [Nitrospirota bacterium]